MTIDLDNAIRSLKKIGKWAFEGAQALERFKETPMGRAAQAINQLKADKAALQAQLTTAQANAQDADDIAAEDSVLGPVTQPTADPTAPATPADGSTPAAAAPAAQ